MAAIGAKTLYIESASPWKNGYCESFNSKLRDECLNGEIFNSIKELRVLAERWRIHYNTVRPHSSPGYGSPAPEARLHYPPRYTNNLVGTIDRAGQGDARVHSMRNSGQCQQVHRTLTQIAAIHGGTRS